jgi:hypothetical protein
MVHNVKNLLNRHGKLSFLCFIITIPGKPKKGLFLCDCGRLTTTRMGDALSGNTTSCGRCSEISKEIMTTSRFGRLKQTVPKDTMPGSGKKDSFTCDCGGSINAVIGSVFSGDVKSCGKCSLIYKEELSTMKFGSLTVVDPQDVSSGSTKDILCNCECGRQVYVMAFNLFRRIGGTKSCGKCSIIQESIMTTAKFGHLRQTIPKDTMPGSGKIDNFTCDCGGSINTRVYRVLSGGTKTCGHCDQIVKRWYYDNSVEIKKLKCPIESGRILSGPIKALEPVTKSHEPFLAVCPACKNEYNPRLNAIKQGKHLTCACVSSKISGPVIQIAEFIQSHGFIIKFEHKIEKMNFDIFVINKNLLVEYDGSRWHKTDKQKEKDFQKFLKAISLGFDCIRIQEVEWNAKNRDHTKKQLTNLLTH